MKIAKTSTNNMIYSKIYLHNPKKRNIQYRTMKLKRKNNFNQVIVKVIVAVKICNRNLNQNNKHQKEFSVPLSFFKISLDR